MKQEPWRPVSQMSCGRILLQLIRQEREWRIIRCPRVEGTINRDGSSADDIE